MLEMPWLLFFSLENLVEKRVSGCSCSRIKGIWKSKIEKGKARTKGIDKPLREERCIHIYCPHRLSIRMHLPIIDTALPVADGHRAEIVWLEISP
jgi:hypothetical protein